MLMSVWEVPQCCVAEKRMALFPQIPLVIPPCPPPHPPQGPVWGFQIPYPLHYTDMGPGASVHAELS